MDYMTTRHTVLLHRLWTLSTACIGTNDSQTGTETLWPWASIRWGTPGVWKNNLRDGIQCFHFHCFILNESYITDITSYHSFMKTLIFLRQWPTLYDTHTKLDIHPAAKERWHNIWLTCLLWWSHCCVLKDTLCSIHRRGWQ